VVAFLALAGGALVAKYKISVDALRISGGLVLVLSALRSIFPRPQALPASTAGRAPLQVAISPIVNPLILSPAAVAAILIIMMLAPDHPGMGLFVIIALAIILVLDLIVMYFNATLSSITWLILVLQLLGAVLTFMQVCLGIDTILMGLQHLGAFPQAT
jgi:multiple antibiotic resistance protein